MAELSRPDATFDEQPADASTFAGGAHGRALKFMASAQRLLLDEILIAASEQFERTRTELHLFAEFASKGAEAHSVSNLQTMFEECSRHQIDFLRRDSERLFRHGERLIESTQKLVDNWRD